VNEVSIRQRAIVALVAVNLLWGISFPAMKATNMIMDEHVARHRKPAALQGANDSQFSQHDAADAGNATTSSKAFLHDLVEKTVSASFLTVVRFAIAMLILAAFVPRLFLGVSAAQWRMGIWTGFAFAPGFLMQNVGLNYVPASRSGFLTSLSVVFTPLVMIILERRLPRALVLAGIAVGLFGTAILTGLVKVEGASLHLAKDAASQLGPGDWLTIVAAFIFTIQILLIDHFSRRMPAGRLTPGMFVATLAIGLIVFAVGYWGSNRNVSVWIGLATDLRFLALVTVMSVLCTVLAFHWMNKYQGHVTPAQAALIYTTEPIFATVWAMILPDAIGPLCGIEYASESPGPELLIGGLIIALGNVLALWPASKHRATGP
jgi:drug/metabolite transporter (DMT)-like permease